MKLKTLVATLSLSAMPLITLAADGAAAPAAAPAKPIPQTPEAWLHRMTDFTANQSAYKDPKVFVPWFNAVTEPGFYTTMGNLMMDPNGWLRMMNSMVDPNAYRNMAEWAEPGVYTKWLGASMDPNFYTALLTTMTDPGKMMRWAMMPMDPKMWGMMMNSMNPAMYMKWMMSPFDPKAWQLMMAPINPNLYMGWLGAGMDPKSYGPTWGGWVNAPTGVAPTGTTGIFNPFDPAALANIFAVPTGMIPAAPAAQPAAAGAAPQPYMFNPFDPNAWSQMWQIPGAQPAPAAPPAKK